MATFAFSPRAARVLAGWLAGTSLLAAALPLALAQEETSVSRRTQPGKEVLIRGHVTWDKACAPTPNVQIRVTTPPANGRTDVRNGKMIAGAPLRGTTNCSGREMEGLQLFYTPNPDFKGTEQFQYDVDYGNLHAPRRVGVTVRVE